MSDKYDDLPAYKISKSRRQNHGFDVACHYRGSALTLASTFDTLDEAADAIDFHRARVKVEYWRSVPLPDGVVGLALSGGGYSARWYAGSVSERAVTISPDGAISSRRLRDSAATVVPPGVHAWLIAQWELAKRVTRG